MTSRRNFLKWLGKGAAAAPVVASLPAAAIKPAPSATTHGPDFTVTQATSRTVTIQVRPISGDLDFDLSGMRVYVASDDPGDFDLHRTEFLNAVTDSSGLIETPPIPDTCRSVVVRIRRGSPPIPLLPFEMSHCDLDENGAAITALMSVDR